VPPLRVARVAIPSRNRWPSCRGLELFVRRLSGDRADEATLGAVLKEPRFADVFTALAEDLARRVTEAGSATAQVKTLLGQLARWQKFLAASAEGLSVEEQRGLFGELHVWRAHSYAVLTWGQLRMKPGLGLKKIRGLLEMLAVAAQG
jgi:Putative  PD-(D/E)XK family member, (DUF4420)